MKELAPQTYTFAEYEVDLARRLLLRAGQSIPLNAKAFDLLVVLIENRGRVIAKEELKCSQCRHFLARRSANRLPKKGAQDQPNLDHDRRLHQR